MFQIGVDIDGVLADFEAAFAQYLFVFGAEEDRGRHFVRQSNWDFSDWDLHKPFPEYYQGFVCQGGYRYVPLMTGCIAVLEWIRQQGHQICLITNRGASGELTAVENQQAIKDTAFWLEQFRVPYDSIYFVENKTVVHPDIMIEDSPSNLRMLKDARRELIVFRHPYNDCLYKTRHGCLLFSRAAHTWHDVLVLLKQFFQDKAEERN